MRTVLDTALKRLALGRILDPSALLGGAFRVLAIRVMGAALAYLAMVMLIRWMGVAEFGIYSYVLSWATIVALLLPLGLNAGVLRFIPEYQERRFMGRLKGVISRSRLIVTLVSTLGAGILLLGVIGFRDSLPSAFVMPLIVSLACIPVFALMDLHESFARAFGWPALAYGPPYVLQPLIVLMAAGAFVFLGHRLDAAYAMAIMMAASALCLAWQMVSVQAGIRERLRGAKIRFHTRYWMAISVPMLLMEAFRALLEHTDIIMLGSFAEPETVAAYVASVRTAGLLGFVFFAIAAMAVPKIPEAHFAGGRKALQKLVSTIVAMIFLPSLLLGVALLVFGPWILTFFSPDFASAYPAMAIVICGYLFRAATGPVEYMLNLTGHQRECIWAYVAACVFNIAANLALIPSFGLMGAALATASSTILIQAWLGLKVWRHLGVIPFVMPFLLLRDQRSPMSGTGASDADATIQTELARLCSKH